MSLADEIEQFRLSAVEISCYKCGGSTGIIVLPWGPSKQGILCDTCSQTTSPAGCFLCEGRGRVYVPSISFVLSASDIKKARRQPHSFAGEQYWMSCVCVCEHGHKFRIKTVNDDGSVIFVAHQDNASTKTFLEMGYTDEDVSSFRKIQEKEIDW